VIQDSRKRTPVVESSQTRPLTNKDSRNQFTGNQDSQKQIIPVEHLSEQTPSTRVSPVAKTVQSPVKRNNSEQRSTSRTKLVPRSSVKHGNNDISATADMATKSKTITLNK